LAEVAGEGGVPVVERGAAPERVDRAAAADGEQPPRPVAGDAVARPGHQRLGERLLREVLGQREVAGVAGERADDPRRLDPPDRGDGLAARAGRTALPHAVFVSAACAHAVFVRAVLVRSVLVRAVLVRAVLVRAVFVRAGAAASELPGGLAPLPLLADPLVVLRVLVDRVDAPDLGLE